MNAFDFEDFQNMSHNIINRLACPFCSAKMVRSDNARSLVCGGERRHCFDFSSSGYVNLAITHSEGGDSKMAVRSRSAFLEKGYYERVSDELNRLLDKYVPSGFAVDAGCGEGYYITRAVGHNREVCGFDLSKYACEAAAKKASRNGVGEKTFFGVASVYEMPLADGCADAVFNVFAPCVEEEYSRVLRDGGYLIVCSAGADHLQGLKALLYDNVYKNETRADSPTRLTLVEHTNVRFEANITSNADIMDLFTMTPYYWRTSEDDKKKLEGIDNLSTLIDIDFFVYRK